MRCLLIVFSLFITLSVHSQETDTLLSQYPSRTDALRPDAGEA